MPNVRLADPKPGFCSACYANVADVVVVDMDATVDRGTLIDTDSGVALMGPDGTPASIDNLYLCKPCIQAACEVAEVKPIFFEGVQRELKQVRLQLEYWREHAHRSAKLLAEKPEEPKRGPGRPRKAVAV